MGELNFKEETLLWLSFWITALRLPMLCILAFAPLAFSLALHSFWLHFNFHQTWTSQDTPNSVMISNSCHCSLAAHSVLRQLPHLFFCRAASLVFGGRLTKSGYLAEEAGQQQGEKLHSHLVQCHHPVFFCIVPLLLPSISLSGNSTSAPPTFSPFRLFLILVKWFCSNYCADSPSLSC